MRVEDYREILALHRFLFESKGDDLTSIYAGSPYIAAVQNRLADALEAADPGDGWTNWRAADGHETRVEAVRRHLRSSGDAWNSMSPDVRAGYVRDLLAPLRLPETLLAELIKIRALPATGDATT
ncbi:hypothetical protein [Paractinoplanes ovalisporus]|uniref:hypothetical protein n=1 Tax=Paractinoplanes ovalisporus TaxID=2810368 RepID=UPI0027DCB53B|nr:hypothetical protein [Actinoplanes ovalisporus]